MNIFLPAIIITILFWIVRHNAYKDNINHNGETVLERESRANSTRKQDISGLDYIKIPIEQLPFGLCEVSEAIRAEEAIKALSSSDILNLTGITNTELKLQYGPANLDKLSQCDERFTRLVRSLQQWGQALYDNDMKAEAITVLQYSVDIGSDIRGTYELLASHYSNDKEMLTKLREQASSLRSLSKTIILDNIDQYF